jgi:hypothetical protein
MIDYEKQHKIKKRNAEFGYALVWLFCLLLIIVLPMLLRIGTSLLQYILAAGAVVGIVFKIHQGIQKSNLYETKLKNNRSK